MRNSAVIGLVLVLVYSSTLHADWSGDISPDRPTSTDVITVFASGSWLTTCVPNDSTIAVDAKYYNIYMDVLWDYPPGRICTSCDCRWSQSREVGPLSPGVYRVFVHVPLGPSGYELLEEVTVSDKQFTLSDEWLYVPEAGSAAFSVSLIKDPLQEVEVTVAHTSGDADISVEAGAMLVFDSNNYSTPQPITLSARVDEDQRCSLAVFSVTAPDYLTSELKAVEFEDTQPPVLYVDSNDPAAFASIQDAVDAASDGFTVLVPDGVYTGPGNTDIQLFEKSITVKSENGPDTCVIDCQGGPRGFYLDSSQDCNMVIDGFTVTNALDDRWGGKGIYCIGYSAPTIRNCIVTNCTSQPYNDSGVGIQAAAGTTVENCTLHGNSTGIYARDRTTIMDCLVTESYTTGILCFGDSVKISSCRITENYGPGVLVRWSSVTIDNCLLSGNDVRSFYPIRLNSGAGVYCIQDSTLRLVNSAVVGNFAEYAGAGILCGDNSEVFVENCTIACNKSAGYAGGIYAFDDAQIDIYNSIVYGNSAAIASQIYLDNSDPMYECVLTSSYSNVQAEPNDISLRYATLRWLTGNINVDPGFVDPGFWDPSGTLYDANDDFWIPGDYHLKSEGWRWDADSGRWTYDDQTSRCIDAGDPGTPLADEPLSIPADPNNEFGQNLRINMGAYGGTSEASIPPNRWAIHTDYNNDGLNNFTDFALYLRDFEYPPGQRTQPPPDFNELRILADSWLEQTTWFATTPPVPPTPASNPNPTDGAIDTRADLVLTWLPSSDATWHDIYFGTTNPPEFQMSQTVATFDPGPLAYETTYYWRIDERNQAGTTTGIVWSFSTWTAKSSRCFPADTLVWVDGKPVPIIEVRPGQKVRMVDSAAEADGKFVPIVEMRPGREVSVFNNAAEVEWLQEHGVGRYDCYDMTFETGNSLVVVHSHNFLTVAGEWVAVENLRSGSKLQSLNGPITITSVVKRAMPFVGNAYNLKIRGANLFFVGKDGVAAVDCSKLPKE